MGIGIRVSRLDQQWHGIGGEDIRRLPEWCAESPSAPDFAMQQRVGEGEAPDGIAQGADIERVLKLENSQADIAALAPDSHEILDSEEISIASREGNLRSTVHRGGVHQAPFFFTAAAMGETNSMTFCTSSADFPYSPIRRTMALPTTTASDSFATSAA